MQKSGEFIEQNIGEPFPFAFKERMVTGATHRTRSIIMEMNHFMHATVINANNIMALSVMRSLGRHGIPVHAFFGINEECSPYNMIVRHSRYIEEKHFFEEGNYAENMLALLVDYGRKAGEKSVLFPVSDQDMIIISEHRKLLSNYYNLLMPPHEILDTLLNKEKFCRLAEVHSIPVPRTYYPVTGADIDLIAREIDYPCIIKPSWRDGRWLGLFGNTKVIISKTPDELRNNYHRLTQLEQKMIVQEIVEGDEINIFCAFTYLDNSSEMLGITVCRKIRQFPRNFGNTSLAETVANKEVEELTSNICKKLSLTGYVSIEFKRDRKSNDLKIIEITPARINRQAGLADDSGFDIPYTWYCYLSKGQAVTSKGFLSNIKWLSEVNELRTLYSYLKKGDHSIRGLLQSYKNIKRCEIWSRDDVKPFLYLLLAMMPYLFSQRSGTHMCGESRL